MTLRHVRRRKHTSIEINIYLCIFFFAVCSLPWFSFPPWLLSSFCSTQLFIQPLTELGFDRLIECTYETETGLRAGGRMLMNDHDLDSLWHGRCSSALHFPIRSALEIQNTSEGLPVHNDDGGGGGGDGGDGGDRSGGDHIVARILPLDCD